MNSFPIDSTLYSNPFINRKNTAIILGGGLSGLAAGYTLAKAGRLVTLIEGHPSVGGLSRTITHNGFRFDLGGHRFHTKNEKTETFVKKLLEGNYLSVSRKSCIFLNNRFFDYPLKPTNALFGFGIASTAKAVCDYGHEKIKNIFRKPENISLEDWVISNFGRTMFNTYFRDYSEKVWGIPCDRISEEWVSKRIEGLSLWVAIKKAFLKFSGQHINTFTDKFIYPALGIGQIPELMKSEIEKNNTVMTSTIATMLTHQNFEIKNLTATNSNREYKITGSSFISSIPLTNLLNILNPLPPAEVIEAASRLKYRDLVVVTVMLDRERVTDLTWMYIPEKHIPVGRIHEPKNWSPSMAPEGKTHIVAEYFCNMGDSIWNSDDRLLTDITSHHLEELGFIRANEITDSCIVRVPKAYPVLEVGYADSYAKVISYLSKFKNLRLTGRTGMFRYYNMDRAIESGIETAEAVINESDSKSPSFSKEPYIIPALNPVS